MPPPQAVARNVALPMRTRPSIPFLLDLLRLAVRKEAAAVYVVPWMPPTLRIDDRSVPLSSVAFTPEQSTLLVLDLLDDAQRAALDRSREIQFSFVLEGEGRFRVHAFRRHGQPAMSIRPFAMQAPTPASLGLPAAACNAVMADRGLLLLAGRSAALRRDVAAALLEHRNDHGQGELVVLDDASRFWHERRRCQVRQGLTATGVDELLLRRHRGPVPPGPIAIAWGELRDALQLDHAVRTADRALCIATLDADSMRSSLLRLLDMADEAPGAELRYRSAMALHGVLALRAVPALAGGHHLAATELLMNSPDLAATLAEGERPALMALLAGQHHADDHLAQLVAQGLVRLDDALRHAVDRDALAGRTTTTTVSLARARAEPAAPVLAVDTGFADLFDTASRAGDPFDFADGPPPPAAADTQFDGVDWAAEVAAAGAAAAPRAATPDSAEVLPGAVQFHAWAPAAVAPGQALAIDLWAALPAQAAEVAVRAARAMALAAPVALDEGAIAIGAQLRIDGLLPAAATQRLGWRGRPERVRFALPVPERARPGAHAARLRLTVAGLPIGELSFVVQVRPSVGADAAPEDTHAARRMLQSAYAAYAAADRAEVDACVQALQQVAPGLQVFTDAPQLRNSPQWRERIERELGQRERLFLFWSAAAAESPWVDFEWRLALRRRGAATIDAVLLDPPRVAPLPPELGDLVSAELRVKAVQAPGAP
jgi:Tfp pilus assembly ATPase PilU